MKSYIYDLRLKMKNWKKIRSALIIVVVFVILFAGVSDFMTVGDSTSLANIRGFYMEPENSLDVALIGPSEFYADYSATRAWEQYGYTSYSLAVAGVPGNLYKSMLAETLKRQSPKLVVFEVNGFLQGDEYFERQGQIHSWIDNIPWSENKIQTIEEVVPKDQQYSYFCKIATYHNNWKNLGLCARGLAVKTRMSLNGYSYCKGFGSLSSVCEDVSSSKTKELEFTDTARGYMEELLQYCKDQGVENVLFVRFPHGRKIRNPEVMQQVSDLVTSYGYDFLNLNDSYEEIGIEPDQDFYNVEHLNVDGMQKMTTYFGKYICDNYAVNTDHTNEQKEYWNQCAAKMDSVVKNCKKDMKDGVRKRYNELSAYHSK